MKSFNSFTVGKNLENRNFFGKVVTTKKISVIVSAFNEEGNISQLITKITDALDGYNYELIIINDGSIDNTEKEILEFSNSRIKLISFVRNFGQTATLAAGINYATGDYCVTLDGDLQNDPADIPKMIQYLMDGNFDMVVGWRKNRQDKTLYRKIPSYIANLLIRKTTGIKVHDLGCALKVMKTNLAKSLSLYGEMHRYISLLAFWKGAKMGEVEVNHLPRVEGKSKYGLNRTFNVISDIMFLVFFENYRSKPIHFFGKLGISSLMISGLIGVYLFFEKLQGQDIGTRPLLILFILFILTGILFFSLGFISELLNKIMNGINSNRNYEIRDVKVLNFGSFENSEESEKSMAQGLLKTKSSY
jgi:glycosyltransferase involved in cell wall biosynthesis